MCNLYLLTFLAVPLGVLWGVRLWCEWRLNEELHDGDS